jgi:2-haloacid dehalogenase
LGAEAARAYKPQPESYTRTAEILGLKPEEVALVAAHNGDLRAARASGLKTCFVFRRTEHGKDQATDMTAEDPWDVVAESFEDVADQLGC